MSRRAQTSFVLFLCSCASIPAADKPVSAGIVFEKEVLPILQARCLSCHGAKKQRAELDLRSKAAMMRGGESGAALAPGTAKKSLLWEKIITDKMPPGKEKLSQAEKGLIRAWIDTGAHAIDPGAAKVNDDPVQQVTDKDRDFWSFQPPVRPTLPSLKNHERARNPIDAFVLAALEKQGLTLSPEADRVTLLRRACFDLLGLPPTPEQIRAFLADERPGAYERLIDRFLGSTHYGERWARHWLDVAGYADSEGILDADYVRKAAWRYRDYVISAFNKDKSYDRFLKEQIAGDELVDYWTVHRTQTNLPPNVLEALIATGYLRCASDTSRPDFVKIKNAPGYYFQTLNDTLQIVSTSVLGLTVQCAKCHSHKYDPIPQRDFYRMQSIFMSGYRPSQWVPQVQRRLLEATSHEEAQAKQHNAQIDQTVAKLRKEFQPTQKKFADELFEERLKKLPEKSREDVRAAFTTDAKKRTKEQTALVKKYQAQLVTPPANLPKALSAKYPKFKEQFDRLTTAIHAEESKRKTFAEIRAFYDLPGDAKTHLLRRGDYLHPGREVRPGVLSVLAAPAALEWKQPAKEARTSGRRLAFANWITQPNHPLTARVLVNRLWLHHFGQGIVSTPDNFGRKGSPPSHPQLLDWLATELVRRGWSVKQMHRLILTSTTYRQSSRLDREHAKAKAADPENRLLWRQRFRRLEAEAMRDAILEIAGTGNGERFGPPVPMQRRNGGEVDVGDNAAGHRRSIYLQVRRSQPLTFLQAFDQPVIETNCTRRDTSTVSSQALTLLNSDFMVRQARAFAERVLGEAPDDAARHAVLVALGRLATTAERERFEKFLADQSGRHLRTLTKGEAASDQRKEARVRAVADLCHVLLSANEMAYVD